MGYLVGPKDVGKNALLLDARFRLNDAAAAETLFREGHIPGAQRIDLEKDLTGAKTGKNGRHPLPTREALREVFSRLGIGPNSEVVLYDDTDHAGAARAWMLLRWMGQENVKVLDGGLAAWKDADLPIEKGAAVSSRPRAEFKERPSLVKFFTKDELGGKYLVDARMPERFRGDVEPLDAKAGHIPGAENIFYQNLMSKDGGFLPVDELRDRLPRHEAVYYCGSGVTSAVLLLAAAEAGLAGGLYPGSWSEWSSDPVAPVETGLFRRGVVAVIQNDKGEVLLFERADHDGSWQFPQGGIEKGETEEEALHRELDEEAGIAGVKVVRVGDFTTTYEWPGGKKKKGRTGQRHWWFLCELPADGKPNLSRSDHSFRYFEWLKPEEVVERFIDWKQPAAREGLRALRLLK